MPTKPRRLPVLVERAVHEVEAKRTEIAQRFEMNARAQVSAENKTITCRAGCAWCCHHPVLISVLEGIGLYRWLQKKGKWNDKLKAKLREILRARAAHGQ